jgi:hemerythrin
MVFFAQTPYAQKGACMEKIKWNDTMSVGSPLIDEQHRTWMGHFNTLAAALDANAGQSRITETLGFLADYTKFHFLTEQQAMQQYGYPEFDNHRQKHDELSATLADLVRDFEEEGATQSLAEAVNTFLGNWLVKHIQQVDSRFGAFLKEKGVELKG